MIFQSYVSLPEGSSNVLYDMYNCVIVYLSYVTCIYDKILGDSDQLFVLYL